MTMLLKIIVLYFLLNSTLLACGTENEWMDAYEDVLSSNSWRNSMNKLESLFMLSRCSSDRKINKENQFRIKNILTAALGDLSEITKLEVKHSEIRRQVEVYRNELSFKGLLESIYRNYSCLPDIVKKEKLINEFGENSCSGTNIKYVRVNAKNGARLRAWPKGAVVGLLKHNSELQMIGKRGDWFRVLNPLREEYSKVKIAYVHESVLFKNK